jgi:Tfp pilus assembly protein PilF
LGPERPAELHNNLGVVLARRGELEAARAQFLLATADGAYAPDAQYNLGLLEVSHGELPRAIERFETALQLDPSRRDVAVALGDALCRAGRLERAEELEQSLRSRGDPEAADRIAARIRRARNED